jgi:hypothetical protein
MSGLALNTILQSSLIEVTIFFNSDITNFMSQELEGGMGLKADVVLEDSRSDELKLVTKFYRHLVFVIHIFCNNDNYFLLYVNRNELLHLNLCF